MLYRLLFEISDLRIQLLDLVVLRGERDAEIGKLAAKVRQPGPVVPEGRIIQNLGHRLGRSAFRRFYLRLGVRLVCFGFGQIGLDLPQLVGSYALLSFAGNDDTGLPRVFLQRVFRILKFFAGVAELRRQKLIGVS